jgi:hypothetical protein
MNANEAWKKWLTWTEHFGRSDIHPAWAIDLRPAIEASIAEALAPLRKRIEKLEKTSHPPFDFTTLIDRIETLERGKK